MNNISGKIQHLRKTSNLTQSALASKLGVTRACVNAWEMGISVPSVQSLIDLSLLFDVSTDYILGLERHSSVSLSGLHEEDIKTLYTLIDYMKKKNLSDNVT